MIVWEGWKYDPKLRRLLSPRAAILTPNAAAVFGALLLAEGAPVSGRALASEIARNSRSQDPLNCVGMTVHKLNAMIRGLGIVGTGIENVRRFGYRLRPAVAPPPTPEEAAAVEAAGKRRAAVEAILIDELEATGPHARAVSRAIEEVYGR